MKVLVKIYRSPEHRFLVNVSDQNLIRDINSLISRGKYARALVTVLSKGEVLKEISERELPEIKADLVLTEKSMYRDLT